MNMYVLLFYFFVKAPLNIVDGSFGALLNKLLLLLLLYLKVLREGTKGLHTQQKLLTGPPPDINTERSLIWAGYF